MPGRLSPSDILMTQDYPALNNNGTSPSSKKRKRDGNESGGPTPRVTSLETDSPETLPSHGHPSESSDVPAPTKHTTQGAAAAAASRPRKRLRVVKNESQIQPTPPLPASKSPTVASAALSKSNNPPPPASLLSSCHICYRRPLTKTQLSSYGDCEACQQRTCFICLRVCEGFCQDEGREKKICSTCCVEQGPDGTVFCLDCLGRCGDDDGHHSTSNARKVVRTPSMDRNNARSRSNGPGG